MDGESASPNLTKSKRGRKGRPPKVKQSADRADPTHISDTQSPVCQTSTVGQPSEPNNVSDVGPSPQIDSLKDVLKQNSNDNLLMPPPPPAPSNSDSSGTGSHQREDMDVEELQENELIIDGFSICHFESEVDVEAALKACGKAYQNRRLAMDQAAMTLSKPPKLPVRDSRSPTGRRKSKAPAKPKEPKTPKLTKKMLQKSPLARSTSRSAPNIMLLDSSSSPASETFKNVPETCVTEEPAKKEEITMTLMDFQNKDEPGNSKGLQLPILTNPELPKTEPLAADLKLQIKSELNVPINSHPRILTESKAIKLENSIQPVTPPVQAALGPPLSSPVNLSTSSAYTALREPANEQQPCSVDLRASGFQQSTRLTPSIGKLHPDSSTAEESISSESPQGADPLTWPGSTTLHSLTAVSSLASESTPSFTTAVPSTTRSGSVHSATSSTSRRTPVCTPSVSSTPSREKDSSSSRAASRGSDRNTSRTSQPPTTSSAEPFSGALFGSPPYGPINPAMISFGAPNGLTSPFNYPGATGMTQPHSGFAFGSPDLLPPFSHASSSLANQEYMKAELSRRVMMQTNERGVIPPPFFRPDQMFHSGPAMNNSSPNMPPAMLIQQMLDKMPKMDPIQQMIYQRTAAAAAVANTPGSIAASPIPVSGASLFQSVPGGYHNSSASHDNAQKKSGKWCAAHVRVAYHIYNSTKHTRRTTEEAKNGLVTPNKAAQSPPNPAHSIGALASNIHRPKDLSAPAAHIRPKPSPAPSPSNRSLEMKPSASPSPLNLVDKTQSRSSTSNPNSPVSATSATSKELSLGSRSLPNGSLSVPSPKGSRWSKVQSTPPIPSTSHSTPVVKRRDRDDRERRSNGASSYNSLNVNGKRPSPSTQSSNKKHRSRSRSPPKSSPSQRHNGHVLEKDSNALAATATSIADFQQQHHQQILNNMFTGIMDKKSLPHNGFPPNSSMYANYMNLHARDLDSQRERLYSQMNPSIAAMAFAERGRQHHDQTMKEQLQLLNSSLPGLNGFHHSNALSNLGSLPGMGGPPPLIPTSQAKMNLPPPAHHSSPSHSAASAPNGTILNRDRYTR